MRGSAREVLAGNVYNTTAGFLLLYGQMFGREQAVRQFALLYTVLLIEAALFIRIYRTRYIDSFCAEAYYYRNAALCYRHLLVVGVVKVLLRLSSFVIFGCSTYGFGCKLCFRFSRKCPRFCVFSALSPGVSVAVQATTVFCRFTCFARPFYFPQSSGTFLHHKISYLAVRPYLSSYRSGKMLLL